MQDHMGDDIREVTKITTGI